MGVSIRYCGQLDDLNRIEEFEDRVLDVVSSLGGQVNVWRSYSDEEPYRTMRGLVIEMAPGQESLSLILSPEGYFTPLHLLATAEYEPLPEPPECTIKTQLGGLVGHLTICHLLGAIKTHFASDFRILDESGFWHSGDIERLMDEFGFVDEAFDVSSLPSGCLGLSREAAEDPKIIRLRNQRIARFMDEHFGGVKTLQETGTLPSENPSWFEPPLEEEVERMETIRKHNELRNERISRVVRDAVANGGDVEEAIKSVLEQGKLPNSTGYDPEGWVDNQDVAEDTADMDSSIHEADYLDEESLQLKHPSLHFAESFYLEVIEMFQDQEREPLAWVSHSNGLVAAAGDIVGGLVQATVGHLVETIDGRILLEFEDRTDRALAISQLKRAQRGHGFARGSILALSNLKFFDEASSKRLLKILDKILFHIRSISDMAWDESTH